MNIELALEEHLPKAIDETLADIARLEGQLAEKRVRLAKLHRIAAAADVVVEPGTVAFDDPPLDIIGHSIRTAAA